MQPTAAVNSRLKILVAGEFARSASRRICRKTHPAVNKSLLYRPPLCLLPFLIYILLSSSPSAPIGDRVSLDPCCNWFFGFKQKTLVPRSEASGDDGDFEPPRPLAAILRDAKRANSPASVGREFPAARRLLFGNRFLSISLFILMTITGIIPTCARPSVFE